MNSDSTPTAPYVAGLRSVALNVPDLAVGEDFYTRVWHLDVVAREPDAIYFRGTGAAHHILSLHQAEKTSIRDVTFNARSIDAMKAMIEAAPAAGGQVVKPLGEITEPGGGTGFTMKDPDGRIFRFVFGDAVHTDTAEQKDRPIRLAHSVLNSHDVAASQRFMETVMHFKLSDRTRIMAFMRCNSDHHSIALGDANEDSLNHIAFMMPDLESVMRGGGRMKDAGFPIQWGPGRHGPGNNSFNYFIGPFGVVIEYTSEVQQVDDTYRTGSPDDWKWPAGRVDHWGISNAPSADLKEAQKSIFFAA